MCVCVCVCILRFQLHFKFLYEESDKCLRGPKHVACIITQFCQMVLDILFTKYCNHRNVLHRANKPSDPSNKFPTLYRALSFIAAPTTACHLSAF